MEIEFDQAKRDEILKDRNLDLADAAEVFEGFHLDRPDDKHSEDEERTTTVGMIGDMVVIVIWTTRNDRRRIVTMWKANEKEREIYRRRQSQDG